MFFLIKALRQEAVKKSIEDKVEKKLIEFAVSDSRVNAIYNGTYENRKENSYFFLVNPPYSLELERELMKLKSRINHDDIDCEFYLREWAIKMNEIEDFDFLKKCIWKRDAK